MCRALSQVALADPWALISLPVRDLDTAGKQNRRTPLLGDSREADRRSKLRLFEPKLRGRSALVPGVFRGATPGTSSDWIGGSAVTHRPTTSACLVPGLSSPRGCVPANADRIRQPMKTPRQQGSQSQEEQTTAGRPAIISHARRSSYHGRPPTLCPLPESRVGAARRDDAQTPLYQSLRPRTVV